MNSPINHGKKLEPALVHAPPPDQTPQVPPMPRVTPIEWRLQKQNVDHDSPSFSGDCAILARQRPLTLDPDWMPEPPQSFDGSRSMWTTTLRVGGVMAIAALIVWVVVAIPKGSRVHDKQTATASEPSSSTATASQIPLIITTMRPGQPDGSFGVAERPAPEVKDRSASKEPAVVAPAGAPPAQQMPAMTVHEPPPAQPSAADFTIRQLDRDRVTSLLKRGQDFIKSNDLVSARLVFRRAAEAGDAGAALMLAGTFDPKVLEKLGFTGFAADVAMARLWYERAEHLGSVEAPRRLEQLVAGIKSAQ